MSFFDFTKQYWLDLRTTAKILLCISTVIIFCPQLATVLSVIVVGFFAGSFVRKYFDTV